MCHLQRFLWLPGTEFGKGNELIRILQREDQCSGELKTEKGLEALQIETILPAPEFPAEFIINPRRPQARSNCRFRTPVAVTDGNEELWGKMI